MPRKLLERSSSLPYHVTARVNNREKFPIPLGEMWNILTSECLVISRIHGAEIHAFVMMPNHFHMMLTAPELDLGEVMRVFMSSVTRTTNLYSGRSGHLFGGPYFWSLIRGSRYFGHALKYVYRNPVKAGLCPKVEDYRFSSIQGLIGGTHLPFPIYFSREGLELGLPLHEETEWLDWLNRPFPAEAEALIKANLRKKVFETIKDRDTRRPMPLMEGLL